MATTGRSAASTEPDAVSALVDAEFVRVTAAPTGGSVAAAALVAGACGQRDVPYQVRVARSAPAPDAVDATHVAVGFDAPAADAVFAGDAPNEAFEVATEAGSDPSAVLAFAGALADGGEPSSAVRSAADLSRRPGAGIPTADLAAGLAHSTLVHASFSGDEQAAGATLSELALPPELDESARRRLASAVALDATGDATERAADAVSDVLRPHETPDGPFETVEGYADVLGALAFDAPGLGVALALGAADAPAALDAWKVHASEAHRVVRAADPARHSGVVAVDADAAQPTVARLVRDYRSVEPAVLAVGEDAAALATTDADARDVLPGGVGTETLAVADATNDLLETVRGEL
ncbi:hypothetical protein [Halobacterium litoreum]|uniref:Exonuclease RecJ n=1 Tax=Halobacterium litoreum TaxID=2039234 RepID=A0ABD5NIA7_9EURY|nr:hypothetical protein [Halobacterium litoreum]UHH12173.1 hypothetical protein LT972_08395 [Halobacterium litoreum]